MVNGPGQACKQKEWEPVLCKNTHAAHNRIVTVQATSKQGFRGLGQRARLLAMAFMAVAGHEGPCTGMDRYKRTIQGCAVPRRAAQVWCQSLSLSSGPWTSANGDTRAAAAPVRHAEQAGCAAPGCSGARAPGPGPTCSGRNLLRRAPDPCRAGACDTDPDPNPWPCWACPCPPSRAFSDPERAGRGSRLLLRCSADASHERCRGRSTRSTGGSSPAGSGSQKRGCSMQRPKKGHLQARAVVASSCPAMAQQRAQLLEYVVCMGGTCRPGRDWAARVVMQSLRFPAHAASRVCSGIQNCRRGAGTAR